MTLVCSFTVEPAQYGPNQALREISERLALNRR